MHANTHSDWLCNAAALPKENDFAQHRLAGHYVWKRRLMNMLYKQLVKVQSFHRLLHVVFPKLWNCQPLNCCLYKSICWSLISLPVCAWLTIDWRVYTVYHSPQIEYIILPCITTWIMHTITANKTTVELHRGRLTFNGCTNSRMVDSGHRQVHEPTSKKNGWWTTTECCQYDV